MSVLFSYNNYYNPYTPALHNIKTIIEGALEGECATAASVVTRLLDA